MRNYINLFFLLLIFLSSCGKKKLPPGVLDHKQISDVLVDVHIVDGSMYTIPQMPDTLYKYGMSKYLQVFKQHRTDSLQFRKSMEYYSKHPDELDDIYAQVIQNLQTKLDKVNKTPAPKNALPAK